MKEEKKEKLKQIILELHKGLSLVEAKEKFEREIGEVTSTEIAEMEQSLINEGLSPDDIKKFCNVHALLFESSLKQSLLKETAKSHPISLFKAENREVEKITKSLKNLLESFEPKNEELKNKIKNELARLKDIEIHYTRKEQLLFPYLERHGFPGPSKVMWGKDNEIRGLLKADFATLEKEKINSLIEEVDGMIFKEENILFPASLEKLAAEDWLNILKQSDEVGYAYIPKPESSKLVEELKRVVSEEAEISESGTVLLPTGELSLRELTAIFRSLPLDLTYVDKDDLVKFFSDNRNRIFLRTRAIIGRKVQNCHPPQSLDKVEQILNSFKNGSKEVAQFWINLKGRLILIKYFAVRDKEKNYLGTLEVSQDVTDLKNLQGERRLLD